MPTQDNPIIHIVLNRKGGIGKSTLSTMLAQWKVELAPGCVTSISTVGTGEARGMVARVGSLVPAVSDRSGPLGGPTRCTTLSEARRMETT